MEGILINELVGMIIKNEQPSTVIICAVVIWLLIAFKNERKENSDNFKKISESLSAVSNDVNLVKDKLGLKNVIKLPSNKEPTRKDH